jgi:hypothetical protein
MRANKSIPFKGKANFAFVVDGECEFWYIQMLKRNERTINVNLEPKIPQRKKLEDQYKHVIELSENYDKVFWIIDLDVIDKESQLSKRGTETALQKLIKYCNSLKKEYGNVIVIINNPCLEFWLLLHFETTSKYFDNCDSATKQLKRYLQDYEKTQAYYTKQGSDIYTRLKPYLATALANANKLAKFNFDNVHVGVSQMQLFFNSEKINEVIMSE